MRNPRNLTVLIGTVILSVAVVIGAMPADTTVPAPSREAATRIIRVGLVEETPSAREVRLPAVTRSSARAALAFTVPARVASRPVDVGDRVRAGQILASLDQSEYALAHRSAEAVLAELDVRLDQARRDEARVQRLASAKAATAEELEKTQAGTATLAATREAAAARVEDTRRLLEETVLRAPFDGTVTAVKVEPGEWASPGKTVVELSGSGRTEVKIELPETIRARVEVGTGVNVDLPMSKRRVTGRIVSLSDAAAGSGSLFPAIVALESGDGIVAGLAAEVVLPLGTEKTLTVPLAAVLDSGSSRPSVFVVRDGIAARVSIHPGQLIGDRLTIDAAGIAAGEQVAILGHTALVDGDKVEVR